MQLELREKKDFDERATRETADERIPRVAIVSAGFVGSTTAYALTLSGMAAEVVLIDRNMRRAEGHVNDLRDAAVFSHATRVFAGDFSDCCLADVTVITTGVSQSGKRSRVDGLLETGAILRGVLSDVCRQNLHGILLIASNPVDVLTYAAWRWSGLPAGQVIGSGTSLDTSRFRRRLAERYRVASDNVHAYVIGEHGDSQIPILSSARVAGSSLEEFCKQLGLPAKRKHWRGSQTRRVLRGSTSSTRKGQHITELRVHWSVSFAPFYAMKMQY